MLLTDGSIHLLIQSVSVEHNGMTCIPFSLTKSHFNLSEMEEHLL